MKKTRSILVILMALMLVMAMVPVTASADILSVGDQARVTASFLMYRAGPGVNYTAMTQYPMNTVVTVLQVSGMGWWYRCKTPDGRTDGWMFYSYLQKVGGGGNTATTPVTAAPGTDYGVAYVVKNNGNFVNLRAGGGTNYGTIAQLADGTALTMQNKGAVWSYVKANGGLMGWVMTSLIQKSAGGNTNTGANTAAPGTDNGVAYTVSNNGNFVNLRSGAGSGYAVIKPVPDGTKVTMISKNAVWSYVNAGGTNGWMMTNFLKKGAAAYALDAGGADYGVKYTVKNNGNYVNLRSGAGSDYGVIKQVADGTQVTMLSRNAVWSNVNAGGTSGWMMTSFLVKGNTAPAGNNNVQPGADNGVAYVVKNNGNYVNLREGAGSGYAVIRPVPDGTQVTMISRNNQWSYINVNGAKGWMMTSFLQKKGAANNNNNAGTGTNAGAKYVISNKGMFVNLRSGAGNGYGIIKPITDGTVVTMVDMGPEWSKVLADGSTGYVMTSFLKKK